MMMITLNSKSFAIQGFRHTFGNDVLDTLLNEILIQVSISSMLNARIFRTKVLSAAFSSYVLGLTSVRKHICT